jgi:hypothetical protein
MKEQATICSTSTAAEEGPGWPMRLLVARTQCIDAVLGNALVGVVQRT